MTSEDIKIILFLCSWGPHSAYQRLQDEGYRIPGPVQMVRIPCTGRISKALLFKAFEMGADGVALVGCSPGTCRYGSGTVSAEKNTADTRAILDLLGVGGRRMGLATFLPDEAEALERFLAAFVHQVETLGKSPVRPARRANAAPAETAAALLARHNAFACQDCGKCTASCPLALSGRAYSPRAIVSAIIRGEADNEAVAGDIHACLTCGLCHERCPSDVNFPAFVRDMRWLLREAGADGRHQPHGGFFQSLMRAMGSAQVRPRRWERLPPDIRTDPAGKILFFGGCAPYFDAFFKHHHALDTSKILTDALRLLNFFDVEPRLMAAERCCGHDLLWSGDREGFLRLGRLNVEEFRDSGVEQIITACPECFQTLGVDYGAFGLETGVTVTHLYDFLETQIDKGAVGFKGEGAAVAYQRACRLDRSDAVRALPRRLLGRLAGSGAVRTAGTAGLSSCCGNCAWSACDASNKALQVQRLREIRAGGAGLLVTSCPKCQIHLRCAMEDPFLGPGITMEMADLTSLVAQTICWE